MIERTFLLTKINEIRKKNRKALTNNFLSTTEIINLCNERDSLLLYNENALIFARIDVSVTRIYFYLVDFEFSQFLKELVEQLDLPKPYLLEYICKGYDVLIEKLFAKIGFNLYTIMLRMQTDKLRIPFVPDDAMFQIACSEDVPGILSFYYQVFDPLIAHLPTEDKLRQLVEDRLVYCAKDKGKIIGAFCFEMVGQKALYSYLGGILEEYQQTGMGVLLFMYSLTHVRDNIDNYTCWMSESNMVSQKMHKYLGFKPDGLKTYVFIKK